MKAFVVIHPFGDYKRGDAITDPREIDAVMDGENAHHGHFADHPEPAAVKAATSGAVPTAN